MKIKVAIKSGRSSSLAALHSLKAFLRDAPDFCSGEPGSTPGGGTLLSESRSLSENGDGYNLGVSTATSDEPKMISRGLLTLFKALPPCISSPHFYLLYYY